MPSAYNLPGSCAWVVFDEQGLMWCGLLPRKSEGVRKFKRAVDLIRKVPWCVLPYAWQRVIAWASMHACTSEAQPETRASLPCAENVSCRGKHGGDGF